MARPGRAVSSRESARCSIRLARDWLLGALPLVALLWMLLSIAPALAATVNGLTITENLPDGSRGSSYNHTIAVTGGTPPYTFTVLTPNNLPPNLTLSAGGVLGGVISCVGNLNGNYKQRIRITDSSSPTPIVADFTQNPDQLAFNVTTGPGVCVPLTLSPASLPSPAVGVAYAQTIAVTNGIGPYSFAVTSGALPAGLSLNTATGQIMGTPTTSGGYSVTITATDAAMSTGSIAYSGTVLAPLSVNPASLPATTVNVAYSQSVTASGGTGPYSYALAGSLPAGLSLNASTGAISGTPSASGTFSFTVSATDSQGASGSRAYSIVVNAALSLTPATLPATTQGAAYNQTVSAAGGTGSKTFGVSAGSLPGGLSLNSATGAITGTSSAAGTFNFTVGATDAAGATASQAYSIVVNAPITVNPASLPATTRGIAYSPSVSSSGGTGTTSFSVSAGSLPPGVSLDGASGALSGTPSAAGTFNFTVTATDSVGATGSRAYALTVNAAIAVAPASLPAAMLGAPYNQSVTATGGTGTINYGVSVGSLPSGLSLNTSTGAITGMPAASGSFNFTITAVDALGASGATAYSFTVNGVALTIVPATLPATTQGLPYTQAITASGGTAPYTYALSGSLPAGLSLNASTGAISGTTSSPGTYSFTITATDSVGATASRGYSVVVNPPVTVNPALLPAWTQGTAYSQTVGSTGGTGAVTFSVTTGSLPTGLSLNGAGGAITGTPSAAGYFAFTITATDAIGATGSRVYSVTINAPLAVNPATLPAAAVGTAYNQTVIASGGTGAATFAVTAGSLPTGLSLNAATGAITGTPSASSSFNFTITATDTTGATGARAYSVNVSAATLNVDPLTLPATTQGLAYSQSVTASGGTAPYAYSSSGALPTGLSLNASTGAITGTAAASGTFSFTITATDGLGASGNRAYSIVVNAPISLAPASLPSTTQGVAYSQSVTGSGGTGALTYSVSAGALPPGMSLSPSSGALTGTPSASGTYNFTITATDALGATASRGYSVVINPGVAVNPATVATGTVGIAYSQSLFSTGGTGATTFGVTAGTLPAGLSLSSTGALAGTPSVNGTFNFTVTATDAVGATGSRAYALAVNPGVAVGPASLPNWTQGASYSQAITATGGNGSYAFGVSAGTLPAGVTLNPGTGVLSGTPTGSGTFNFTVSATDGLGATGSRSYTVVIAAAIAVNPASLPSAALGSAYGQTISATGGTGASTFAVAAGTLPTGLVLNGATGALTGTPSAPGTFSFTITATDSVGATGSRGYTVTVNAAVAVNPASLSNAVVGAAYTQTVVATGGSGPYTFSVSAGALPAGLTLNTATGVLSGTPTTAATSNFTITAADGMGASGARAYSIQVFAAPTVNPPTLPSGGVGTAYSQTIGITGGSGSAAFAVTAGTLPAGLALNGASGVLSGTPTATGTSNFTITATDGLGATAARAYTLTINAAMTLSPATVTVGTIGRPYSLVFSTTGGSGTYTYAISAGSLPPGFALNASTGALTGTPSGAGTFHFSVATTDSLGATATRSYMLTLNAAVAVGPATLADPVVGTAYSQAVTGSGGTGSYAFTVSAGALPPGISLVNGAATARRANAKAQNAPIATLAGTPTTAGTFTFTITATDDLGLAGSRDYALTVAMPTLSLVGGVVPGAVGAVYSGAIAIAGGSAPYTYVVSAGQLPPGVALHPSTGALAGVPTVPGTYIFTVTVTDSFGATGSFPIAIDVAPRPDPTQDPTVRSIHAAQVSAAARYGAAQVANIGARLQMLHLGHDPCVFHFGVGANIRWDRAADADTARPREGDQAKSERKGCDRALAVWAGGNLDFGFLRPSTVANRSDFRTEGVTLGADARLGDGLIVGAALGYGRDQTDADGSDSAAKSHAQTIALYGSYRPLKAIFVDAVAGYGSLSYDLARWQSDDRVLLGGERDGSQWFVSLGATAALESNGVKLAPYARIDRVQSRLDGYAESGNSALGLAYDATSFSEDTLAAGVYAGLSFRAGGAIVEPGVRIEQRRVRTSSVDQGLAYRDMPATPYVLRQTADGDNRTSGALSVMLRFGLAASLGVEYSYTGSSGTYRNESVRAILRAPF